MENAQILSNHASGSGDPYEHNSMFWYTIQAVHHKKHSRWPAHGDSLSGKRLLGSHVIPINGLVHFRDLSPMHVGEAMTAIARR